MRLSETKLISPEIIRFAHFKPTAILPDDPDAKPVEADVVRYPYEEISVALEAVIWTGKDGALIPRPILPLKN